MRTGTTSMIAAALGVLVVASCGDSNSASSTTTRAPQVTTPETAPIPTDACEVVTPAHATEFAGVAMVREPENVGEPVTSSCKYVSIEPKDPAEGRVLRLLRVDIFAGSQFFDVDGIGYPEDERDDLEIGDQAFVHVGDELRGVTVQVRYDELVISVNYTEQAILTGEQPNAASKRDDLVALVERTLGRVGNSAAG